MERKRLAPRSSTAVPARGSIASIKKSTIKRVEREGRALRKQVGTADSFVNYSLQLGLGAQNALAGSTYGFNPVTRVRTLLEWIHRGSWMGGVAVDLVADDMTRGGVELLSTNTPNDEQTIQQELIQLAIWTELCDVVKWSRLYGGCIGVLLIDGQDPSSPLRIKTIGKDAFRGLMVLDRWMVEPNLYNLVKELGPHLGLPEWYTVTADAPAMRNQKIHFSRCIRLEGVRLPYWQRVMENLWGLSVYERLYDRMVAFDSATTGGAQLVYKSFLRTYGIEGFRELAAAGGPAIENVKKMVNLMAMFQGIEGITLMDVKDKFEAHSNSSFTGLADALVHFGQQISGALQIPLVRLFGQSPAGLNSTGESDLRTYYDGILQQQERTLREGVNKIIRCTAMSKRITLPDTFGFNFLPLWQLTEEQKGSVADRDTRMVLETEGAGLVSQKTALQELRERSKITGRWTNVTDEMIEQADDTPQAPEAPGMGGEGEEGGGGSEGLESLVGGSEGAPKLNAQEGLPKIPGKQPGLLGKPPSTAPKGGREHSGLERGMEPKEPKDSAYRGLDEVTDQQKALLRKALSDIRVANAIRKPRIDREHDVRSGAVSSKSGGLTYVSSMLPHVAIIAGAKVDPALPLNVHEQVEWYLMVVFGLAYAAAHAVALLAERLWLERQGVSWPDWEHWINGELGHIEHGPKDNPPPEPHIDPEVALGHRKKHGRSLLMTRTDDGDHPYSFVGDLQVVIEQPKGSIRRGEDWQQVYAADYGFIRRVGSAEGDEEWLDCFVGPTHNSRDVWVIDSVNPQSGKFDEHKLCLGFKKAREAIDAYKKTYGDWRKVGAVTHMNMDSLQFKDWLANGDKRQPMHKSA